ncbi:MAG: hypothetical protein J1F09_01790 [Oscillospiraceae bacterium]|nr:hypothetical protein [Oscillospiraceae bacterium]
MSKNEAPVIAEPAEKKQTAYTKRQIVNSEKFSKHRDLLNALLKDDKSYTEGDVKKILDDYLKGKVK